MNRNPWLTLLCVGLIASGCVIDDLPGGEVSGEEAGASIIVGGGEAGAVPQAGELGGVEAPIAGGEAGIEPPIAGGEAGVEPPIAGGEAGGEPPIAGGEAGVEPPIAGGEGGVEGVACEGDPADPDVACEHMVTCYAQECPDSPHGPEEVLDLCMETVQLISPELICGATCAELSQLPTLSCDPLPPEPTVCDGFEGRPTLEEVCSEAVSCYVTECPSGQAGLTELHAQCMQTGEILGEDVLCDLSCLDLVSLSGATCEPEPPILTCDEDASPVESCNELISCVEYSCPWTTITDSMFLECVELIEPLIGGGVTLCDFTSSCEELIPVLGVECLTEPPLPEPTLCEGIANPDASSYCDAVVECVESQCPYTDMGGGDYWMECVDQADMFGVGALCGFTCSGLIELLGDECVTEPPSTPLCDELGPNPEVGEFCDSMEACVTQYCPYSDPNTIFGSLSCEDQLTQFAGGPGGIDLCTFGFSCQSVVGLTECLTEPPPPPPVLICDQGAPVTTDSDACQAAVDCYAGCANEIEETELHAQCMELGFGLALCQFTCDEIYTVWGACE